MPVFENFKLLKKDMEENGWVIEAFPFDYKENNFIVLTKLYLENEKRPQYALLKTEIVKNRNFSDCIKYPVNSYGFIDLDVGEFRKFFNIEFSKTNLGNLLKQFQEYFSKYIPTEFSHNKPEVLEKLIVTSLSTSDSEDPNKLYCYNVTRLGNRSPFNDNKTRILRPELYDKFKDDPSISFCYKSKKEEEETDGEILAKFAKRIEKERA